MTEKRKVVDVSKGYPIKESKNFIKKTIFIELINIFTFKTIITSGILYIVTAALISVTITLNINNYYDFALNIISFITPFYAITIGFSITTIVFILNNAKNFKSSNHSTLKEINILIVSYMILGLSSILFFLFEVIFGGLISYSDKIEFSISTIIYFIILLLLFVSFHFFFTIIKIIYYLSNIILVENFRK